MARDKIVCNGTTFTETKIKSGNIFLSNSIAFDELGIDTLNVEMDFSEEVGTIFAPKDYDGLTTKDNYLFTVRPYFYIAIADPSQFTYGKRVDYYRNEKIFGSFYIQSVKRVGKFFYAVFCVSAIGLLETVQHYGGLYTGQTFEAVTANIIRDYVPYTMDANVKNISVYGWLPVSTARNNLRQLLFACGVAVKKDSGGDIRFALLNTNVPLQIPENRIMLGGSVEFPALASEVIVSEHSYFISNVDETVTLYDGNSPATSIVCPSGVTRNGILIKFDFPVYGLSADGATILESGVNYAVLSGGGYANLTGKKYAHTIREVQREITSSQSSRIGNKNTVRVDNATLVSLMNSESVAERVASYYSSSRTVRSKILFDSERPGDNVTFNNPFRESETGIISSMSVNMSGVLVADTEFVAGYTPTSGGTYQNRVLLTGSGTFTVPAGVTKLHTVLIGGGQGGYSGLKGKAGIPSSVERNYYRVFADTGQGGNGGEGGKGGGGGRIYQSTVYVTPGQTITYTCGTGGAGGASNTDRTTDVDFSSPGNSGSDTTFGNLSSSLGSSGAYGYKDIFSDAVYGQSGEFGTSGGQGGGFSGESGKLDTQSKGPPVYYNGVAYVGGDNNTEFNAVTGSAPIEYGSKWYITAGAVYGAGGGAAAGRNGSKSTNAPTASLTDSTATAIGGAGGQGADAVQPTKPTVYGNGGTGGNGGGGEGGPGFVEVMVFKTGDGQDTGPPWSMTASQRTGLGRGLGSRGGTGADGCVLIYY